MLSIRSTAALAGLVPAVAAGAAPGPVPSHQAAKVSTGSFRVAVSQHYGRPGNASGFSVIVVTGSRDGWAFGGTNPGGPSAPVAEQWNGSKMTPSRLPAGLTSFISDASARSGRDIWVASEYGRYVLHWNGHRWTVAMRWGHGLITGLTVVSARDVWVFGPPAAGSGGTGAWHFDGRSWAPVFGPARTIYRASTVSRRDIWALSASGTTTRVLRFDGSRWRLVHTGRALKGVQPDDILAISDGEVWVVGNAVTRTGAVRLVLAHWNGMTWTRFVSRLDAWAGRLAPGWQGGVLITATPVAAVAAGLVLRASALGFQSATIIRSAQGSGVSDVALARGTRSLWASGGILTRLGGNAAIWVGPLAPAVHDPDDT
jgi:hypothetical protein